MPGRDDGGYLAIIVAKLSAFHAKLGTRISPGDLLNRFGKENPDISARDADFALTILLHRDLFINEDMEVERAPAEQVKPIGSWRTQAKSRQ